MKHAYIPRSENKAKRIPLIPGISTLRERKKRGTREEKRKLGTKIKLLSFLIILICSYLWGPEHSPLWTPTTGGTLLDRFTTPLNEITDTFWSISWPVIQYIPLHFLWTCIFDPEAVKNFLTACDENSTSRKSSGTAGGAAFIAMGGLGGSCGGNGGGGGGC